MKALDPARIPRGEYCYDTEYVPADPQTGTRAHWQLHFDRRCPYWRRTDHATVCCDFLHVEHYDDTVRDAHARAEAHFGSAEEAGKRVGRSLLYDEIKLCDINLMDD